jgi:hypothetical protein
VRRDLVLGRILLGTLLSALSRTYFAALAGIRSFLAPKERRIQALTKKLYMALRSKRILSFSVAEGWNQQRPWRQCGKLASFGFMAAEPVLEEQFCPNKSQMEHCSCSSLYFMMCTSCESRLIQIFDPLSCLDTCLAEGG